MLRKDLAGIVCDLSNEGIDSVVITNGTLLSDTRLNEFPEGTVFEITLFSTDKGLHDKIAGKEAFEKVLNGLVRIKKHKCRFVIALVINRLNARMTLSTIEFGIALGAEAILLNRVNLNRNIFLKAEELVPCKELLSHSLEDAEEASIKYGVSIAVSVPIPPCVVDPGKYPHLYFGWCPRGSNDSYYTVSSSGFLRPCNHSSVILGDLLSENFSELVQNQKARKFWSTVPFKCLQCTHPLKQKCLGGCPAAAYECYGSNAYMDPIVEFATGSKRVVETT